MAPSASLHTDVVADEVKVEQKKGAGRVRDLLQVYSSLAKVRLSSLVVVSTMVGFYMSPLAFVPSTFVWASLGTSLAIASANTFNQVIEVDNDSRMNRTLKRTLPSKKISITHAVLFGAATGMTGVGMLAWQTTGMAASLAFSNILLYTLVYTPLKQLHPVNTWVGSVVGALPPMIGWAASTGALEPGAWALAAMLYVWQIPHFLSLSWRLRHDYAQAGYKMLSNVSPEKLPAANLRWTMYLFPIGALCSWSGMTTWTFAVDSCLVNSYLLFYTWKFYKDNSNENSKKAFMATLLHLPLLMGLMMFHKKEKEEDVEKEEDSGAEKQIVEASQT